MKCADEAVNNWEQLPATELIDMARAAADLSSLYSLALRIGLHPSQVQKYYRNNSMPRAAALLIVAVIRNPSGNER